MMMLVMVGAGCSSDETEMKAQAGGKVELTVSAAVSLQDALNDIKKSFEKRMQMWKFIITLEHLELFSNRYPKAHLLTCFSQQQKINLIN